MKKGKHSGKSTPKANASGEINYEKATAPKQEVSHPDFSSETIFANISEPASDLYALPILSVASKQESRMTPLEKMNIARSGVSKNDLEKLKEKAALDYDGLAKALSVTRATLINKKGKDVFNPVLSERIVGLADIYSYGYEVFGDKDRFNRWLFRPNQALGGQPPFELIDNQFGREELRNMIGRIEYGVYS